jgi:hypothetical protein
MTTKEAADGVSTATHPGADRSSRIAPTTEQLSEYEKSIIASLEDGTAFGFGLSRPMPVKPKGAKDRKPRKKRAEPPKHQLPAVAREEGRTELFRVNGMLKPVNALRIKEEPGTTAADKLDRCIDRLRRLEG